MTARFQYRLRGAAEEPINSRSRGSTTLGLPPEQPTLPSLLRAAGYRTALVGKWHLGYPPAFGPLRSGYEEFFGPMSGGVDYFSHCDSRGAHDLWQGEDEHREDGYLTDLISSRAVDWIERIAPTREPFFLSVHYTAPHWPWETRDDAALAAEVKDNLFHLHGGSIHTYRRMIDQMDEGIGWIIAALERDGVADDTLVVFTSDNGGERFSDNWPLVGGKMDLTEGGIRVPWIAHWPAGIAAGGVSAQLCMTMDWSATMLEVGGAPPIRRIRSTASRCCRCSREPQRPFARPLHWRMNHRGQRALRQRPLEVPEGRRPRVPVRHPGRRARARQPRAARAGAARRDARGLGSLERDDAADPRRRDGQPRLRGEGHAAALTLPSRRRLAIASRVER